MLNDAGGAFERVGAGCFHHTASRIRHHLTAGGAVHQVSLRSRQAATDEFPGDEG